MLLGVTVLLGVLLGVFVGVLLGCFASSEQKFPLLIGMKFGCFSIRIEQRFDFLFFVCVSRMKYGVCSNCTHMIL